MDGRILVLTSEYPPLLWGGVGRYVMEVEEALAAAGDSPVVRCVPSYALRAGGRAPRTDEPVFFVEPGLSDRFTDGAFDLSGYRHDCDRLAERVRASIPGPVRAIFLQDFYLVGLAEALSRAWPTATRAYFSHLPLSARFTYFEKSATEETQQALEAAAVLWARHVLAPSRFARRNLSAVYPIAPERIEVVPLAVRHVECARVSRAPLSIACLGRFTQQKGWEAVLDVVSRLEERGYRARYEIVGSGAYRERVESRLRTILPAARLRFHGYLEPRRQIPELMARSTVFLQMSAYETFGLAALEAAAQATVPVLTCVGAIPEVLPPESGAVLVPPGDTATAARAIERLFDDAEGTEQRSARLRRHAAGFRWSAHAARLSAILAADRGMA